jgi:flagellar biosynthesis/type III secretory pathway protein FliH
MVNEVSLDIERYEARVRVLRDELSSLHSAYEEGLKKGFEQAKLIVLIHRCQDFLNRSRSPLELLDTLSDDELHARAEAMRKAVQKQSDNPDEIVWLSESNNLHECPSVDDLIKRKKLCSKLDKRVYEAAAEAEVIWTREGVEDGRWLGRMEGYKQGRLETMVRLLDQHLGRLDQSTEKTIRALTPLRLDLLCKDFLHILTVADLNEWLQKLEASTLTADRHSGGGP